MTSGSSRRARPRRITGSPAPRARATLLVIAAAIAMGLLAPLAPSAEASCSPAPFVAGFREAQGRILTIGDFLGRELNRAAGMTNGQIAGQFAYMAGRLRDAAADLDRLDPPPPLAAALGRLTRALQAAASDLTAISRAARAGNAPRAASATRRLLRHSTRIRTNRRFLDAKTRCT